jgi:hypothetical protein
MLHDIGDFFKQDNATFYTIVEQYIGACEDARPL